MFHVWNASMTYPNKDRRVSLSFIGYHRLTQVRGGSHSSEVFTSWRFPQVKIGLHRSEGFPTVQRGLHRSVEVPTGQNRFPIGQRTFVEVRGRSQRLEEVFIGQRRFPQVRGNLHKSEKLHRSEEVSTGQRRFSTGQKSFP